jgi:hypothetical protein
MQRGLRKPVVAILTAAQSTSLDQLFNDATVSVPSRLQKRMLEKRFTHATQGTITMLLKSILFRSLVGGAALVGCLAVVELAAQQSPLQRDPLKSAASSENAMATGMKEFRQREGVAFEQEGMVQFSGERLTFVSPDGKLRLLMLENLALDRVARTLRDSTVKIHWKLSGTLTEFQGSNYLLLDRAEMVQRSEE